MELTEEVRARRVAIAEDVLVQLARKDVPLRLTMSACYIYGVMPDVDLNLSLKGQVDTIQGSCTACASFALLLSKARLMGEVSMADFVSPRWDNPEEINIHIDRDVVCYLLEDIFDVYILERVESFFDGDPESMDSEDYYLEGISTYAKALPNPRDRMIELAENIVRNRGEFVVPARYAEDGPASYDRPDAAEDRANSRRSVRDKWNNIIAQSLRDRWNDAIARHASASPDRDDPAS